LFHPATPTKLAGALHPALSADGTKMAFVSVRREKSGIWVSEIYVMNLTGD
jgi:Tol biopolymer transport system component